MTGSSIYALQKTREAVNCLALLDASLRERLSHAAFAMSPLQADVIPDAGLQEAAMAIFSAVLEAGAPDDNKLKHLSDSDVSRYARETVELFERCVTLFGENPDLWQLMRPD